MLAVRPTLDEIELRFFFLALGIAWGWFARGGNNTEGKSR